MTFKELEGKIGKQNASSWIRPSKGSGWIQVTARVDSTTEINGIVSGNAQVSGNARVSGNAQVFGDAWKKSPLFIVGSIYSLTNSKKGHIQIGCECHTCMSMVAR